VSKVTLTPNSTVSVDSANFVYVDGVKIAKFIPEKKCLQFLDKDRIRSNQRGSNVVEVSLSDVAKIGTKE
jgi:hypothetical protein